jgi:trk system potassium uptake protein TrkH
MVLSTFAAVLLGGGLGLRGERALTEILELHSVSRAYRLTRFIVLATLAVEAAGAVALAVLFAAAGAAPAQAAWKGIFHAVSAFCNAGFALQSDSLVSFQDRPLLVLVIAALIVVGGVGFVVLATVWTRLVRRERGPTSVQVRVVLAMTTALLVTGAVLYGFLEWNRSLAGMAVADKLVGALFQSVTLRTAGFNTADFSALAPTTILLMLLFMFVGASPGSTGGGIKTTTAAVLVAAIRATHRPKAQVTLFDREISTDIVNRSVVITVISAGIVLLGLFLLLALEPQPFVDLAFETMSAFGTVGLSLGATAELEPAGKLVVAALMFVGRVGPLTMALLFGTVRGSAASFRQPSARMMVG